MNKEFKKKNIVFLFKYKNTIFNEISLSVSFISFQIV